MTDPRMTPTNDAPVTVEPADELVEMLQVGTETGAFDHTPEEIGLHVMENAQAILNRLAALASAPAGDGLEARFWLIVREPGMVPNRKGPSRQADTAKVLREFMAANPRAFIDHLTVDADGTPWVDHGPEVLQMMDGRSMSVGRKHNARVREAAEEALARPRAAVDRLAIAKAIATKTYAFAGTASAVEEGSDQYDCGEWEEMGCDAQATYLAAADAVIALNGPRAAVGEQGQAAMRTIYNTATNPGRTKAEMETALSIIAATASTALQSPPAKVEG